MHDTLVLAACLQSREAYDLVKGHIVPNELTPQAAKWWALVRDWYRQDPKASGVDPSILRDKGKRAFPVKHVETLLAYYDDVLLPASVPSPGNVAAEVLDLKRHNVGMEMAGLLASGGDREKINKLVQQYSDLSTQTSLQADKGAWEIAAHWSELDEEIGSHRRIPLAPKRLNDMLNGGPLPGHHIVIFGRPEVGKSLIALNAAAGFVKNRHRTLYIGNEDAINVMKGRMRCRLANMTDEQVRKHTAEANRRAESASGDWLSMRHLHQGSIEDIRKAVEEFEPECLIVDQIRNLQADGKMTDRLEEVAKGMRALLSTYSMVGVSVTQANDRTERAGQEPPIWLGMGDVDSSRTGLPGQADLLMGIGANAEMLRHNTRALSFPKNKISGKHEGLTVTVDPLRNKVM